MRRKIRAPLSNKERLFGAPALLFAAALALATYATSALAAPATHQVVIEGMQFSPQTLTVKPGDTVVWVNNWTCPVSTDGY